MNKDFLNQLEKPYKFFVTGTCTDVGKTYVSVLLLNQFNTMGLKTVGMKPIASGCNKIDDDPMLIQQASSVELSYETICLFSFEQPVAPHIAAQMNNQKITKQQVVEKINHVFELDADVFVIEGAGGWSVPINDKEFISDIVRELNIPVVLVVGIKLGCINHALLTAESIKHSGANLIGWYANCINPKTIAIEENIATLQQKIPAPCLGVVPFKRREC